VNRREKVAVLRVKNFLQVIGFTAVKPRMNTKFSRASVSDADLQPFGADTNTLFQKRDRERQRQLKKSE
jgi:hypothetical protein